MSNPQDLLRPAHLPTVSLDSIIEARNVEVVAIPSTTRSEDVTLISGITVNSKEVSAGDVFVAVAGAKAHGAKFAQSALDQGATAILTDNAGIKVLREVGIISASGESAVPVIQGPSGTQLRHEMARWASAIYSDSSSLVQVSGVTGTNGKTTTCFFLDAIHRAAGSKTALLGTVEMRLGDISVPSERTTVEAPVLQGFFARCVEDNIEHVSMEVSSHALVLDRVTGTKFDVVGFTNLQHDHLDFHNTMDEYLEAKGELFSPQYASRGVIVADDVWARKLATSAKIDVTTISTELTDDPTFDADYRVENVRLADSGLGLDFEIVARDGSRISSHSPLLGAVNVSNAALATIMAIAQGCTQEDVVKGLNQLAVVPGRMEVVSSEGQPLVIVDYAHTAEALDFALESLKQTHHVDGSGKLIVVFGAAGERDALKRPIMGEVSIKTADVVFVTDDDPYGEDTALIRDEVSAGIYASPQWMAMDAQQRAAAVRVVAPREAAIEQAILMAQVGDTVLLAGRGHETIQEIAGVKNQLDDRVYAREVLAKR